MGNTVFRHIEDRLRSFCKVIKKTPGTWLTILLTIISGTFFLGQYTKAAQKDREIIEIMIEHDTKILNLEHQHQAELQEREQEIAEWKEKYFQLLMNQASNKSSP